MIALLTVVLLATQAGAFEAEYRAGLQALNQNDLATSRAKLEAASKLRPSSPQVWLALAQVYFKSNQGRLAESAADKAELLGGDDPVIQHALAFFYTESKQPGKAAGFEARYAEKASAQDPDAFPRAIDLYLRAKDTKSAALLAQKAIARDGQNPVFHELLAKAYSADDQFAKAVPEYQKALELRSYDEGYYFEFADALLHHEKFSEALTVVEQGLRRFDKSAQLELARGVALYGLRRFPETIDSFLKVIQLDPDADQPYLFLGRMLDVAEAKMPEVSGALASYASRKPESYMSTLLYAKALIAQRAEPDQVEPLLRRSIKQISNYWESHYELGVVLESKKDFAGSALELERAIALNPKEPGPHYHLARVYDRLGKTDEAAKQRALHQQLTAKTPAAPALLK